MGHNSYHEKAGNSLCRRKIQADYPSKTSSEKRHLASSLTQYQECVGVKKPKLPKPEMVSQGYVPDEAVQLMKKSYNIQLITKYESVFKKLIIYFKDLSPYNPDWRKYQIIASKVIAFGKKNLSVLHVLDHQESLGRLTSGNRKTLKKARSFHASLEKIYDLYEDYKEQQLGIKLIKKPKAKPKSAKVRRKVIKAVKKLPIKPKKEFDELGMLFHRKKPTKVPRKKIKAVRRSTKLVPKKTRPRLVQRSASARTTKRRKMSHAEIVKMWSEF